MKKIFHAFLLFALCSLPFALIAQVRDTVTTGQYMIRTIGSNDYVTKATRPTLVTSPSGILKADTVFYVASGGSMPSIAGVASDKRVAILLQRGGTYSSTITVPRNNVIYGSYGSGPNPVISGLATITGWTNEGAGIYSKVLTVESNPEIVTVNGVQKEMGRTPNSDRYNRQSTDFFHIDSYSGTTQITDSEINSAITNWTGAEAVVRSPSHMYFGRFPISGHSGNTITFTNANAYTLGNNYGYFVQNDLRTLDQLGEWYYGGGKFYMYFGGATPSNYTVKVSVRNKLIDVNNRDYITVKNLKIEGANQYAIATNYGGTSNNLTVDNCYFDFNNISVYGHTSPEMRLTNNTFMRSSGMAIYQHWESDGTYIAYNTIDSTGLVITPGLSTAAGVTNFQHGFGINLTYAKRVRSSKKAIIERNIITNNGYMGMGVSGDSLTVRYNYVDKFDMIQSDGGGIYVGGQDVFSHMFVEHNIVLNGQNQTDKLGYPTGVIGNNTHGIYLDYKSNGGHFVRYNTSANNPLGGIYIHMSQNVTANYNTLYNNGYAFKYQELEGYSMPIRTATVKKNIVVNDTTNNYVIWARSLTNDFNQWGTLDSNYFSADINHTIPVGTAVASWSFDYRSFAGWKTYSSQDAHSYFTFNTGKNTIFDYNAGTTAKTVNITGTYRKADSTQVTTSYTLQPWQSIVLIKDTVSAINIDSIYAAYPMNIDLQDSVASQDGTNSGAVFTSAGKFKGAYDFDNLGDYAYFPINTSTLNNANYSISFWVKLDILPSTAGVGYYLISDIKSGTSYKMILSVNTSNTLGVAIRNSALTLFSSNSVAGAIGTAGQWYHIVVNVAKSGYASQLFINGERSLGSTNQTVTGTDRATDYRFYLGSYTGTTGLDGKIDDVVIRNCWTTAAEAAHIYKTGTGRYYPFIGQ